MKKHLINFSLKIIEWINQSTSESFNGIIATGKLSLVITPFVLIWNKVTAWGIDNQDYILFVLGAIMVDWVFGTVKHIFFTNTFTWKRNAIGLTTKIALAVAGGFLFEGLNFLVKDADFILTSTKIVTRVIIFMYPGISAFENIYIVSGKRFPPDEWMKRIVLWKKTMNPKDLIDKNESL